MIEYKVLPGGIQLVTEKLPEFQSACIGIWIGAGSVCEGPEISGISHYIEHMFFKGTTTRSAKQLAEDTDNLGAMANAFTGKEATCYHIKALTEVFPQAVDILLDQLCNSVFDSKEMGRERGVIMEEMSMVQDTPDDFIMDVLTSKVFAGTPLESTIIGTKKSLRGIKRENILEYIDTYYKKDNIVVAAAGNFDQKVLEEQLMDKLSVFGDKSPEKADYTAPEGRRFACKTRDISQSHIALAVPTINLASEEYYAQAIVNDVLGGSMSSRLFQNIREQRGLAYTVFSSPMSYCKTGCFFIYAGLSLGKEKEAISAIGEELYKLADEGISEELIEIVKQRLKSGYIFSNESMNSRMLRIGKNRLLMGRNYTEAEIMAEIDSITPQQVNDFAKRIGNIKDYSGVCVSKNKVDMRKLMG